MLDRPVQVPMEQANSEAGTQQFAVTSLVLVPHHELSCACINGIRHCLPTMYWQRALGPAPLSDNPGAGGGEASTRKWRPNMEPHSRHELAGRPQSLTGERGIAYVLKQESG